MSIGDSVWERTGSDEVSKNYFMLLYGFFTFIGLAITAIGAFFTQNWVTLNTANKMVYNGPIHFLSLCLVVLISGFVGIWIALSSKKPLISFFGYMLVAAPFGLMLGPVVGLYTAASVAKVVFVTAMLVAVLTVVGAVIPESLSNWNGILFAGLLILLLGQFGIPLAGLLIPGFPLQGALTLWDWLGVFLFSGYVIFDVNQALRVPATVDNAVDCALALYLDIINLFIRLLSIMGQLKSGND